MTLSSNYRTSKPTGLVVSFDFEQNSISCPVVPYFGAFHFVYSTKHFFIDSIIFIGRPVLFKDDINSYY